MISEYTLAQGMLSVEGAVEDGLSAGIASISVVVGALLDTNIWVLCNSLDGAGTKNRHWD